MIGKQQKVRGSSSCCIPPSKEKSPVPDRNLTHDLWIMRGHSTTVLQPLPNKTETMPRFSNRRGRWNRHLTTKPGQRSFSSVAAKNGWKWVKGMKQKTNEGGDSDRWIGDQITRTWIHTQGRSQWPERWTNSERPDPGSGEQKLMYPKILFHPSHFDTFSVGYYNVELQNCLIH